jgi:hypothetical protein
MTSTEIARELRAAQPVAPERLRLRVRDVVASPAPEQRSRSFLSRFGERRRLLLVVPAAAGVALVAAGVIGVALPEQAPSEAVAPTDAAAKADALTENVQRESVAPSVGTAAGGVAVPSLPAYGDRAQRVSAQLLVEVADGDAVSAASQKALATVRSLGGHVVSANVHTSESGTASLVVRVPVARTQEAIVRLSELGTIVDQSVQVDDLQGGLDTLDRTIARLRRDLAAVGARLERDDLEPAERAALLARRATLRAELASTRQSRVATAAEARESTIALQIRSSEESFVTPVPSRLDRALDRALDVLAWEGVVLVAAAVVLAPLLLLGGLLVGGRRLVRRRDEERLLGTV